MTDDRLLRYFAIGLSALGIGLLLMHDADAHEMPCGPTAEVVAKLKEKYNEVEVGGGIVNEQSVMIPFASPDGATWTVLEIRADGTACVVGVGQYWFPGVLPKAPVPGERPA